MVLCPNGAQGDSPGQSEAPPWDWCARHNPSPERAEPAASKPMCYVSPFQGLGELGRGGAPRSPVYPGWRCALPWAISLCPVGANDPVEKTRGLSPGFFSSLSFVGFVQRSPGHLIQALHKQPIHNLKSKNGQPMDRGTYHRARGLFGCSTKNPGTVPRFFQFLVVRRVRAAVPLSLDSSVAQTTKPRC